MGSDSIDKILASRRQAPPSMPPAPEEADKFFSIMFGDGAVEHFLELRFRIGLRSCFAYDDLEWFNLDPESGTLDLDFGGFLVTLKGRGFGERLFDGIRQKRLSWVRESDVEMQDHSANSVYIEEITITPPSSGVEEPAE